MVKLRSEVLDVGYPVHGAKFLNESVLLVTGGGGHNSSGNNRLTALTINFEKQKKPIKRFRELHLNDDNDAPTCMDANNNIILLGSNESSVNVQDGNNHNLQKFLFYKEHLKYLTSTSLEKLTSSRTFQKLIKISKDGSIAAIASSRLPTIIHILDPVNLFEKYEIETNNEVKDLDISPDGKNLAYITNKSLEIISVVTGKSLHRRTGFKQNWELEKVKFLDDNSIILGVNLKNLNGVQIAKIVLNDKLKILNETLLSKQKNSIVALDCNTQNGVIAIATNDQSLFLLKSYSLKQIKHIQNVHQFTISVLTFSPDGKYLASASVAKTVNVVEIPQNLGIETHKVYYFFLRSFQILVLALLVQVGWWFYSNRKPASDSNVSEYFTLKQGTTNNDPYGPTTILSASNVKPSSKPTSTSTHEDDYRNKQTSADFTKSALSSSTKTTKKFDSKSLTASNPVSTPSPTASIKKKKTKKSKSKSKKKKKKKSKTVSSDSTVEEFTSSAVDVVETTPEPTLTKTEETRSLTALSPASSPSIITSSSISSTAVTKTSSLTSTTTASSTRTSTSSSSSLFSSATSTSSTRSSSSTSSSILTSMVEPPMFQTVSTIESAIESSVTKTPAEDTVEQSTSSVTDTETSTETESETATETESETAETEWETESAQLTTAPESVYTTEPQTLATSTSNIATESDNVDLQSDLQRRLEIQQQLDSEDIEQLIEAEESGYADNEQSDESSGEESSDEDSETEAEAETETGSTTLQPEVTDISQPSAPVEPLTPETQVVETFEEVEPEVIETVTIFKYTEGEPKVEQAIEEADSHQQDEEQDGTPEEASEEEVSEEDASEEAAEEATSEEEVSEEETSEEETSEEETSEGTSEEASEELNEPNVIHNTSELLDQAEEPTVAEPAVQIETSIPQNTQVEEAVMDEAEETGSVTDEAEDEESEDESEDTEESENEAETVLTTSNDAITDPIETDQVIPTFEENITPAEENILNRQEMTPVEEAVASSIQETETKTETDTLSETETPGDVGLEESEEESEEEPEEESEEAEEVQEEPKEESQHGSEEESEGETEEGSQEETETQEGSEEETEEETGEEIEETEDEESSSEGEEADSEPVQPHDEL